MSSVECLRGLQALGLHPRATSYVWDGVLSLETFSGHCSSHIGVEIRCFFDLLTDVTSRATETSAQIQPPRQSTGSFHAGRCVQLMGAGSGSVDGSVLCDVLQEGRWGSTYFGRVLTTL